MNLKKKLKTSELEKSMNFKNRKSKDRAVRLRKRRKNSVRFFEKFWKSFFLGNFLRFEELFSVIFQRGKTATFGQKRL